MRFKDNFDQRKSSDYYYWDEIYNSFYFILARATIVNFKYTKGTEPPYFYTIKKDASAVTWVDGNIFKENVIEHTALFIKAQLTKTIFPEYDPLYRSDNQVLYRVRKSELNF